jgi:hypothetical protein
VDNDGATSTTGTVGVWIRMPHLRLLQLPPAALLSPFLPPSPIRDAYWATRDGRLRLDPHTRVRDLAGRELLLLPRQRGGSGTSTGSDIAGTPSDPGAAASSSSTPRPAQLLLAEIVPPPGLTTRAQELVTLLPSPPPDRVGALTDMWKDGQHLNAGLCALGFDRTMALSCPITALGMTHSERPLELAAAAHRRVGLLRALLAHAKDTIPKGPADPQWAEWDKFAKGALARWEIAQERSSRLIHHYKEPTVVEWMEPEPEGDAWLREHLAGPRATTWNITRLSNHMGDGEPGTIQCHRAWYGLALREPQRAAEQLCTLGITSLFLWVPETPAAAGRLMATLDRAWKHLPTLRVTLGFFTPPLPPLMQADDMVDCWRHNAFAPRAGARCLRVLFLQEPMRLLESGSDGPVVRPRHVALASWVAETPDPSADSPPPTVGLQVWGLGPLFEDARPGFIMEGDIHDLHTARQAIQTAHTWDMSGIRAAPAQTPSPRRGRIWVWSADTVQERLLQLRTLRQFTDPLPSVTVGHTSMYKDSGALVAMVTSVPALARYRDCCDLMLHMGRGLALVTTGATLTVWETRLADDSKNEDKITQLRWRQSVHGGRPWARPLRPTAAHEAQLHPLSAHLRGRESEDDRVVDVWLPADGPLTQDEATRRMLQLLESATGDPWSLVQTTTGGGGTVIARSGMSGTWEGRLTLTFRSDTDLGLGMRALDRISVVDTLGCSRLLVTTPRLAGARGGGRGKAQGKGKGGGNGGRPSP